MHSPWRGRTVRHEAGAFFRVSAETDFLTLQNRPSLPLERNREQEEKAPLTGKGDHLHYAKKTTFREGLIPQKLASRRIDTSNGGDGHREGRLPSFV